MSRIINTDSTGKQRSQLSRAAAVALRQLSQQTEFGDEARDLAAFIALALKAIHDGIDPSVAAWEKRGYWLKADRFRMEWSWTNVLAGKMRTAVLQEDWSSAAVIAVQVAQRLKDVEVPKRNRIGTPWVGAWGRLQAGAK